MAAPISVAHIESSITIEGIESAVVGLKYSNPKILKARYLNAVKKHYTSQEAINSIQIISSKELIKEIWDIGDDPSAIKSKQKNLSSVRSTVNSDLKKLYEKGENPEGLSINTNNIFVMSDDAKNDLLESFTNSLQADSGIDLNKISDILNMITNFLSESDNKDKDDTKSEDVIEKIKKILGQISEEIIDGESEEVDEDEFEDIDDDDFEEIDEDEFEDIADDDFEEIDEDEFEDVDDEDFEEIDEDEFEDIEDDDFEEIDEDEFEDIDDDDFEEIDEDEFEDIDDDDFEEIDEDEFEDIDDDDFEEIDEDEFEDIDDDDFEEIDEDEFEDIDDDDFEEIDEDEFEDIDDDFEEIDEDEFEDIDDDDFEEIDEDEFEDIDDDDFEEIDEDEFEDIDDDDFEEIDEDEFEDVDDDDFEEIDEDEFEDIDDDDFEEIDEDEIEEFDDDDFEEIDEDEIEEIDDDDFEEIDEDEFQDIDDIQSGLPSDDLEDDITESEDNRVLAEQFTSVLSAMDRYFNKYLLIPPANYLIGSPDPQKYEEKEHAVNLSDFFIGKFPITNSLFEVFVLKTGYRTTAEQAGYGTVYSGRFKKNFDKQSGKKSSTWDSTHSYKTIQGAFWYQPEGPGSTIHNKLHHPVVQVSLEDALAFSSWVGKRLPTEEEWEAATRTEKGYKYPWGNEWKENSCNIEESGFAETMPVDHYLDFINTYDIADSIGNVLEWTTNEIRPPFKTKSQSKFYIAKGGSWISNRDITLWSRYIFKSIDSSNILGFRCVTE